MHHPAMAHVGPTRTELGTRTIFNILGPLTNPAGVKRQLTGAFSRDLIRPMAETLAHPRVRDGLAGAWRRRHGRAVDLRRSAGSRRSMDGEVTEFEIHPEDAGLPEHPFESILGGTPEQNGAAFRALLDGAPSAYRDAVLLNAAAALVVAGRAEDLKGGAAMAAESIDSGAAKARVEALARASQA